MTIIAWDGHTLAADKQATKGEVALPVTKIFTNSSNDLLIGISGELDYGMELLDWALNRDFRKDVFPEPQRDTDSFVDMLVISKTGTVKLYNRSPYPIDLSDAPHVCIGNGSEFALGALKAGAPIVTAVELTCKYISGCGVGIDTMSFS